MSSPETRDQPLSPVEKARLGTSVWLTYASIRVKMNGAALPDFVASLGQPARPAKRRYSPRRLSRVVYKTLHVGPKRPRCLYSALVLYRLLRSQGDSAVLVIGLPPDAPDHLAHAWVELDGQDIGPPPAATATSPSPGTAS